MLHARLNPKLMIDDRLVSLTPEHNCLIRLFEHNCPLIFPTDHSKPLNSEETPLIRSLSTNSILSNG